MQGIGVINAVLWIEKKRKEKKNKYTKFMTVMEWAITGPILIEKAHHIATELSVAFVSSNNWL